MAHGQTGWLLKGQLKDGTVKAFAVPDKDSQTTGSAKWNLVYKNRQSKWDTLTFAPKATVVVDSILLTALQIDGKGLKEIVLTYTINLAYKTAIKERQNRYTINTIYNLDTRTIIFFARSEYYYLNKEKIINTDSCTYSYNFSIDHQGTVIVKNVKKYFLGSCDPSLVDKSEGIYVFKDGQYIWTKF